MVKIMRDLKPPLVGNDKLFQDDSEHFDKKPLLNW